ncbi:calcium-binding protein [Thauera butanivorans]|uniref:calcium-binding protein n=1 Tax=Thauera butanivorans TaxID=86174 RepID=UPI003AB7E77C
MTNIAQCLSSAELALAAYASLSQGSPNTEHLKEAGLSNKQAELFASNYTVVTQYTDTLAEGGLGTSFSATVFKDAGGNLTLAIRGTAELTGTPNDLSTDGDIAVNGAGYDQIVAMVNWWQRATTPTNQTAIQYKIVPGPLDPHDGFQFGILWLKIEAPVAGTGELVSALADDPDHKLAVTGHSLGGHLAMAFSTLFPGHAGLVTVFNAPGFTSSSANQDFFAALGGTVPTGGDITNVIADEAAIGSPPWSAIAGLHSRPGTPVDVAIEAQFNSDESAPPAAFNHSQQTLTDSLAVYALLADLDPALSADAYKSILNAAVSGTAAGLERIVDAVERVLGLGDTPLPVGNGNRDALHQAIAAINTTIEQRNLAGMLKIIPLAGMATTGLAAAATGPDALAYRYALKELNPFALLDADYSQHNPAGELDLYDPATGSGQLTDEWLADRAALLVALNQARTTDLVATGGVFHVDPTGNDSVRYTDVDAGLSVKVGQTTLDPQRIVFGGEGSDPDLKGGDLDDRLYGGAGDDTLNGKDGRDRLEGGKGNDALQGGKGDDSLYGGAGNDTLLGDEGKDYLIGGEGADRLEGGAGYDTYKADSQDRILDSDGKGMVLLGNTALLGGTRSSDDPEDTYSGGGHTYVLNGGTLTIDGGLVIEQFTNGDLRINLRTSDDPPPEKETPDLEPAERNASPIILDLDGDGIETNPLAGQYYDLDGDGLAERTGWVRADDGLLARDLDNDGRIGSGQELFGNHTLLKNGERAANGFEALAELDDNLNPDGTVGDGRIDANDVAYGELRVWRDLNQNGVSDAGELQTLAAAGVASIATAYDTSAYTDAHGHQHRQIGTFERTDGTLGAAVDVWFKIDAARRQNTGTIELGPDIVFLPNAEGFGKVHDLHQAMVLDPSLKDYLARYTQAVIDPAATEAERGARLDELIYRWSGVENIDPRARDFGGTHHLIDARQLGALEALAGRPYLGVRGPNPYINASAILRNEYLEFKRYTAAQILAQTKHADDFDGILLSHLSSDPPFIAMDWTSLQDRLQALHGANEFGRMVELIAVLNDLGIYDPAYRAERTAAFAAIGAADATLLPYLDLSVRVGSAGNDTLNGVAGGNLFHGGGGDDRLNGKSGDDSYRFALGDGNDIISDSGGYDQILFGAGITEASLSFSRGDTWARIDVRDAAGDPAGSILIDRFFGSGGELHNGTIEQIRFTDGTTLTQTHILERIAASTISDGNDSVYGSLAHDVIDARAGNDSIYGYAGNDMLAGGEGNDKLYGGDGDDTLEGGTGNDTLFGGRGDDIYRFAPGHGNDVIDNNGNAPGAKTDRIEFGPGIDAQATTLKREGSDLLIVTSATDSVRVLGYFAADQTGGRAVEQIVFEGGPTWHIDDVKRSVLIPTAGDDSITGYAGGDLLEGLEGNDRLWGDDGDDTLIGGAGNDTLSGGKGSDIYRFDPGHGRDIIDNNADTQPGKIDRIEFGPGIDAAVVSVGRVNNDLLLTTSENDSVRVINYFPGEFSSYSKATIEQIAFTGGPTWTFDDIRALLPLPGAGNDTFYGYSGNDTVDGQGGNDTLYGYGGDDILAGGDGDDRLYGSKGNDRLDGGDGADALYGEDGDDSLDGGGGDDTLEGGLGDDTLSGGAGNDILRGGMGDDIYLFDAASGVDHIYDTGGNDTLRFATGITPEQVILYRSNDNLVIGMVDVPSLQITVPGYFTESANRIERIVFAGTEWNADDIEARLFNGDADTLVGTAGDDLFVVDSTGDVVIEAPGGGIDTIETFLSRRLDDNVENLTLTGHFPSRGTGNGLDNVIRGNVADNVLDGMGGIDTLIGGAGNDTYFAEVWDVIEEQAGEGIDTVHTSLKQGWHNYILAPNVENVTMSGDTPPISYDYLYTITGNELDNIITASPNAYPRSIYDGGAGADTMISQQGGIFHVDNPGDRIVNGVTAMGIPIGTSWVIATLDWTLGDTLDHLELKAGSAAVNATGNARDNELKGNQNDNVLVGLDGNDTFNGYLGADRYIGGRGDDTYYVNSGHYSISYSSAPPYIIQEADAVIEDSIIELAGEGTDTVISTFDYTLGANLENLTLDSYKYASDSSTNVRRHARIGIGNALNNVIRGNDGANILDGRAGADTLIGGNGDDIYYVDDPGDVIQENGKGLYAPDTDTVISTIAYTLGANLENLTLIGTEGVEGRGNALNNRLDASQNAVTDTLVGGLGDDTYVVDEGDIVVELADEGIDTVEGPGDIDLNTARYANIENLALLGSVGATGTGTAGANVLDGSRNMVADTLIGGAGNDIYRVGAGDTIIEAVDGGLDIVEIFLTPGTTEIYRLGEHVENATIGDSTGYSGGYEHWGVVGNIQDNQLTGNWGDNFLDGGGGADTLIGWGGSDTYVIDSADDFIVEEDGYGDTDTVITHLDDYTLHAGVENLILADGVTTGTGNAKANLITGNAGNNVLDGGAGNDTLEGGAGDDILDGGVGNDTLIGGTGDDIYLINSGSDQVIENAGEGNDTVKSSVAHTLKDNVENLILLGTAKIAGTGNALDNVLDGSQNGAANTLKGLAGDDIYIVGVGDVVSESAGQGTDTVYSGLAAYTLTSNVENLVLVGEAITGTGNGSANTLTGNALDNILDGKAGADILIGGAGDDTYYIDNANDRVIELAGEGIDTVHARVTHILDEHVEHLILAGSSAIHGTGNELANRITGNNAANTLDGGEGNDTLMGGLGKDTYLFGRNGGMDTIIEDDATAGVTDLLRFGADIAANQIWLRQVGMDLELSLIGTGDSVTIQDWYAGQRHHVEQFKSGDGKTLLDSKVDSLVQAMAAFSPPAAGQTTLPPDYHSALNAVIVANWK